MISSSDGETWSEPVVALQPSNDYDSESTCDPSIVQFHGVYYLYHTCISNKSPDNYFNNRICVAMADTISGPYYPVSKPVVQDLTCAPTDTNTYCVGQPSAVVYQDMVYLFFTEVNNGTNYPGPNQGYIYLAVSKNGVDFTWNKNQPVFMQRDVDVKYERSSGNFFMVQGDVGDTHISWAVSPDGYKWTPYNLSNTIATNPQLPAGGSNNNPGLAGLSDGSFSGMTFASFGSSYQVGWGYWHLYRTDLIVNPIQNDCSKCVSLSCDLGCTDFLGKNAEGACVVPGSTDSKHCCSCTAQPPQPDCSACSAGCVAACRDASYNTGVSNSLIYKICGVPGSTNSSYCCSCLN